MDLLKRAAENWGLIKKKKPLIHHITNFVVMNETANVALALGALPVMAHALEEVEEMVSLASVLNLNIGTLTPKWVDSMVKAGKRANQLGVPVILDPVGVGATSLRTQSAHRILREVGVSVLRGNAGEVSILAGYGGEVRGVESAQAAQNISQVAKDYALKKSLVVAITGRVDVVSDGTRVAKVSNGDAMLTTITGTGCMATTVIAAFLGVEKDAYLATIGGLVAFGLAGEKAANTTQDKPGSFHVALYDALASLTQEDILERGKVSEE